jgi:hypothetical protein
VSWYGKRKTWEALQSIKRDRSMLSDQAIRDRYAEAQAETEEEFERLRKFNEERARFWERLR